MTVFSWRHTVRIWQIAGGWNTFQFQIFHISQSFKHMDRILSGTSNKERDDIDFDLVFSR